MAHLSSDHSKSKGAQSERHLGCQTAPNDSHLNSANKFSGGDFAGKMGCPKMVLEGMGEIQIQLVKLFGRIERCREKLDEAFGGQPFLPDLPPDCPANRRRFWAYFEEASALTELLWRAVELWNLHVEMRERLACAADNGSNTEGPKRDVKANQG